MRQRLTSNPQIIGFSMETHFDAQEGQLELTALRRIVVWGPEFTGRLHDELSAACAGSKTQSHRWGYPDYVQHGARAGAQAAGARSPWFPKSEAGDGCGCASQCERPTLYQLTSCSSGSKCLRARCMLLPHNHRRRWSMTADKTALLRLCDAGDDRST